MTRGTKFRPIRVRFMSSHGSNDPPQQGTDKEKIQFTYQGHEGPHVSPWPRTEVGWRKAPIGRPAQSASSPWVAPPLSFDVAAPHWWTRSVWTGIARAHQRRHPWIPPIYMRWGRMKNENNTTQGQFFLHLELESSIQVLQAAQVCRKNRERVRRSRGSPRSVGTLLRLYLDGCLSIIVSVRVFLCSPKSHAFHVPVRMRLGKKMPMMHVHPFL